MEFNQKFQQAIATIRSLIGSFSPKVGIILGSGLGGLATEVRSAINIPYKSIPHFPVSHVPGHVGELICGSLEGVPVACLNGRVHVYEGLSSDGIKMLVRSLKSLGCHSIIITNAAGSIRKEVVAGEICLITDHINFTQLNPMVGLNDDEFGPRFFPMSDAYDPELRKKLSDTASTIGITLHKGVYTATTGPCFETPAEIRMLRTLGADLVGMSTIPEVIVAKHCNLKVLAVSAVTNLAADISEVVLSHEHTLKNAKIAGEKLQILVKAFLSRYAHDLNQ